MENTYFGSLVVGGNPNFPRIRVGGERSFSSDSRRGETEKFDAFARLICRPPQVVINERSLKNIACTMLSNACSGFRRHDDTIRCVK